jgi:ABC-type Zn uptake system ZnuABC Zn-binding protein ZnuA
MRGGWLALLLAVGVALAAPASATLRVLATTTDLASLATAVGGDLVSVETLVPAGADPEAFEPRPRDADRLLRTDVLVRVGLGYDYWLDALLARHGGRRFAPGGDGYVDASKGVPLLEIRGETVVSEGGHAHGVANPHYWLDPGNASIITAAILEALMRAAPESRERLIANRRQFLELVAMRQARWIETLQPFAGTRVIAYHNSWPYFARRFRIDVIDFIEPKPGVSPTPARLAQLIEAARRGDVRAVLHEPYQPEDASRLLAQRIGIPLLRLALSVGSVPGTSDYVALIDYNVSLLADALRAAPR